MPAEPVLTIASLLRDPRLQEACAQWLKGGRYELVHLDPAADPIAELEQRRESFDGVLLEQGVLDPASLRHLHDRGLLLPAVVIGLVSGRTDYHDAEVHLPPDQLEQLSYSVDGAISRFLRRGLLGASAPAPGSAAEGTPDPYEPDGRLLETAQAGGAQERLPPGLPPGPARCDGPSL